MKSISKIIQEVIFISLMIVCTSSLSMATIYYVSSSGNDANSGLTTALPWKTIAKVNSKIVDGDQILFKKGDTFYGTIRFKYSATVVQSLSFGAYGTGANPVITGFTTITGWTNEGSGIYSKVISPESKLNMLIIDGIQYAIGRYPNSSYLTFESASTNVSITDIGLGTSTNWKGAEAVITKDGYTKERCMITNHSGDILTYSSLGTTKNPLATGNYFFQNDLRTLDQYGEWCYDAATRKLSVYFGAVNPTSVVVKAATLDNLVANDIYGIDHITFDNISFVGSNSSTILFNSGTDYCTFQNCSVSFSGHDGFTLYGQYATINNVTIANCNGAGIEANGQNATITNNSLTNIGAIEGQTNMISSAMGIIINANYSLIQYNRIENVGYMGIFFNLSAQTGQIRNNFVNKPGQIIYDSGGIYLGHDHPNTIIDGNIVLNSKGFGIYLDEYSAHITVNNNTVSGCVRFGIFLHKGNNNIVTNNTTYDNEKGIGFTNWVNENNLINNTVTGNKVIAKSAIQGTFYYVNKYLSYITSLTTLTMNSNYYARPIDDTNTIETNLPVVYSQKRTLAQWQTFSGKDATSKKSPQAIPSEVDLQFEYNATKTAKTITLSKPMIDVKGTKYGTSVILQPYTSVVLMKDANPAKYLTEYKSICDGLSYNGWTTTGKYERTLISKSGVDSIVTTYLTVNPKYAVQESITINSGENYMGWTTSGTYSRTLSSISGCDSVVTTLLTVNTGTIKVGEITQTIQLKKGANMISSYLQATNSDVSAVTKTIRDAGNLIKIQNESGSSYENWGILGGWINNLGSLQITEGYKIMVANDCSLQITGQQIALPLNIPLNTGWNIISFPRTDILDAQMIVQSLIDQNVLIKVQDEIGNSIEDWGTAFGGWKNGIGNFQPGKAYRVKVSANAVLTIKDIYPKSVAMPIYADQAQRFKSVAVGNGSDHMNINLVGLNNSGLSVGDELAAFDGDYCVGAIQITEKQLLEGTASLKAAGSTGVLGKDGFDEGSIIHLRVWNHNNGLESGITLSVLHGEMTFSKNSSVLGKMPSLYTSVSGISEETQFDVFPNPSQGHFTVRFSEVPVSGSRIEVLDLSGRTIASRLVSDISEDFDLFGQPAGMYLVKSILGSVEKISKLVIQ